MFEISVIGLGFVGLPLLVSITNQKKYLKILLAQKQIIFLVTKKIKYFQNIESNSLFSDNKLNKIFKKIKKILFFQQIIKKPQIPILFFFAFLFILKKFKNKF